MKQLIIGTFCSVLLASNHVAYGNNKGVVTMTEAAEPAPSNVQFAIVYRAGPSWQPGAPMEQQDLREHFLYVRALHEAGRIVMAGPLGTDGGLMIINARNQSDADSVIANDPAVIAGVFAGTATIFAPRFVGVGAEFQALQSWRSH